ncbi:MAG: GNAT family N-acetyltransferase [Bacteroidales bacterium]|nr:GNAT family N-acetyltransferase [Bacteroidales bacterium]
MKYLQGNRLKLRAAEPEDLELLYRWENDSDVWQVSDTLVPFSRYHLRRFLENDNHDIFATHGLRLMIDLLPDGPETARTVGTLDLYDFDALNSRAGVGILIADVSDRRRGYAAESLQLLVDYCREVLLLHQVYAYVTEDNAESLALFARAGFIQTGRRLQWMHTPDGWKDQIQFQKLLSSGDDPAMVERSE